MKKFNIFLLILLVILAGFIAVEIKRGPRPSDTRNQLVNTHKEDPVLNKKHLDEIKDAQAPIAQNEKEDHDHDHEGENDMPKTDLDDTMLANERIYTQSELEHMTRAQFQHTLLDIKRKLPKISDIKKIPAHALHHTPSIVLKAGRDISVVAEVTALHPEYEIDALNFYDSCARNPQGVTTVKALCLTNIIEINNKNKQTTELASYPKEIVDLSKMVIED